MTLSAITTEEFNLWDCKHPHTEIRGRILRNGVGVWAIQCLRCGSQLRQVSKSHPDVLRLTEKVPFDEQLIVNQREQYKEAVNQRWEEQQAEIDHQNQEWWEWYSKYLLTPTWKAKRASVMERAGGICEGCRRNRATQVHHTTYAHVGDELLFELVAVCDSCHRTLHPDAQ
jgi:hypothetical protein